MAQNKSGEAVKELQAAVNANRNSAEARYLLGLAYLQDKKLQQAETELNEAVKINDKFIQAYSILAQLKLAERRCRFGHALCPAGTARQPEIKAICA